MCHPQHCPRTPPNPTLLAGLAPALLLASCGPLCGLCFARPAVQAAQAPPQRQTRLKFQNSRQDMARWCPASSPKSKGKLGRNGLRANEFRGGGGDDERGAWLFMRLRARPAEPSLVRWALLAAGPLPHSSASAPQPCQTEAGSRADKNDGLNGIDVAQRYVHLLGAYAPASKALQSSALTRML